jgi:hypothetical protein
LKLHVELTYFVTSIGHRKRMTMVVHINKVTELNLAISLCSSEDSEL